ncbi:MAG: helix-turn-helix transcriptional regulator [Planctomycetota bacterium]
MSWLPHALSWGCTQTDPGGGFTGHIHEHDEICLVANDGSHMRHGGRERACEAGTVFLFRRGELHGYRNGPRQQPNLWLVHFVADETLYRACPVLSDADPEKRVWHLDADQLAAWRSAFTRLIAESMNTHAIGHAAALSGWLRLLLVQTARGSTDRPATSGISSDPALAGLWELITQHVESSDADFRAAVARRIRNYDSLRHRFKRVHGQAPRDLLARMRMERAKHLLLETEDAVSAIAERLGYGRLAEFTRAFARHAGCSPSAFRQQPRGSFSVPA